MEVEGEKEQESFKDQESIPEATKGDRSPTLERPHDTASTSINTDFSLNVPESLRSFRIMELLILPEEIRREQMVILISQRREVNNRLRLQTSPTYHFFSPKPSLPQARSLFKLHKQGSSKIKSKTILCSEVKRETTSMSN